MIKIVEKLRPSNNYCVKYINSVKNINNGACFGFIKTIKDNELSIVIDREILEEKYLIKVCSLINEITPCFYDDESKIVNYTFLKNEANKEDEYNRNILLLNFIRNIWHKPLSDQYNNELFFEELDYESEDPMVVLTRANQIASEKVKISPGHSNANRGCKIKTLKEFKKHDFSKKLNNDYYTETRNFLTT